MSFTVRPMRPEDVPAVIALQPLSFPPPFNPAYHWKPAHILRHLELFAEGQFIAEQHGEVVGACSNTRISGEAWDAHAGWSETVGGPFLDRFDPVGDTLYGLDISVHPAMRGVGVGRGLYDVRFALVRSAGMRRYGTACRMPDYGTVGGDVQAYAESVVRGERADRTLTPLLRYGLTFGGVLHDYMEDEESGNAAALLEWLA